MDLEMNIMLVDDFSTMRRIIKKALTSLGFSNFVEAEDGKVALDMLKKEKVGLILADWNMPNMTGIELLRAVRNDAKLKNLPFIMVTAEGQKANIIEAVDAGVTNYIVKPFAADTIKEKLNKIFK